VEVEAAVDATVGSFLDGFGGAGSAEAERPVLELVFVLGSELFCAAYVSRFADDLIGFADFGAEGVIEAGFDEADGEVCNIDADPAAVEFCATCMVVPQPQKGSRTTSPSLELALRMRSSRASGFWVG
jgi:hypothetical protein